MKKVYLLIILLVFTILSGCSQKSSEQSALVKEYYQLLAEKKWEQAYNLLSSPSKEKFSLSDFTTWAELADEAQGGYKDLEIIRETQVTEYGDNTDLVSFGEVTVVLANGTGLKMDQEETSAQHGLQTVVVDEQGEFKIYVQELKKAHFYKALGEKSEKENKPEEAITQFEKALAEDKDDVWAKYHLALNLIKVNKESEALPLLEEVIDQNETVLSFTPVEELKLQLVESYNLVIEIKEKQGDTDNLDRLKSRVEQLKGTKFE